MGYGTRTRTSEEITGGHDNAKSYCINRRRVSLPGYVRRNTYPRNSEATATTTYSSTFESGIMGASIGIYDEKDHRPDLETWSELLKKDIVMTRADVSPLPIA